MDVIGLIGARRTDEPDAVLKNGHVLCCRGLMERTELGIVFLINKDISGKNEEFYSINERVAGFVLKLKRCKLKVVQAYASTSSHDDQLVESLYEDVDTAMNKVKTQYTVLMGDFKAKVGKKEAGHHAVGEYGKDSRNSRGYSLVEFAERHNLRIMNAFFRKRDNRKWTWRSPNGD